MLGITIKPTIGIGDGLQFSSLPENYFRHTGKKLLDVSRPWFFDHNPFVERSSEKPEKTVELWNFGPTQYQWPKVRDGVYLSNAEIHASVLKVPVALNRPRLYRFEDVPFAERRRILLHTDGRSHGEMPDHVIDHVVSKYGPTGQLFQIGKAGRDLGIPRIGTENLWDLAEVISTARMVIGMDSGPGWIAACFPDVVLKVLRTRQSPDVLKDWVPLEVKNIHSHWDDRCRQVFNTTPEDIGFTYGYKKL